MQENKIQFTQKSRTSIDEIETYILENGILKNECVYCGQGDVWNGLPLFMKVDHINDVKDDNRIENIRMLCPNCHSMQAEQNRQFRLLTRPRCSCGRVKRKNSVLCKKCEDNK